MWDAVEQTLGKQSADTWVPAEAYVAKNRPKPKHFVYMCGLLTCNDEAWQLLKEAVHDDAESLPLLTDGSTYHIINVLKVVDALDKTQSRYLRSPTDANFCEVVHYVFDEEQIRGVMLFTIPERKNMVFATDAFKQLVEQLGLNDLDFHSPPTLSSSLSFLT